MLPKCIYAQEKEIIKQQADTLLQNSTPDQVKAKIKELGMTEKEAEAKASAYGIDLRRYLGMQADFKQSAESQMQLARDQSINQAVLPQLVESPVRDSVPGFEGRTGVTGLQPFAYNLFPISGVAPLENC